MSASLDIAVVGAGAAGLTAARLLSTDHRVVLYEKETDFGGHIHTVTLTSGPDAGTCVDTGFIVMNKGTYPLLTRMLDKLEVERIPGDMSFGFLDKQTGLSYSGNGLRGLFAQPANALRPSYWHMLRGIGRFFQRGRAALDDPSVDSLTLDQWLARERFPQSTVEQYVLPMGGAIWSTPGMRFGAFPAKTFLRFFANHGLLQATDQPRWQTIRGGSYTYVRKLLQTFPGKALAATPVRAIRRTADGVLVTVEGAEPRRFDHVVLAAHANESLAMLEDPSDDECRLLGAWSYNDNQTVLHSDASVMPPNRRAWASWNSNL